MRQLVIVALLVAMCGCAADNDWEPEVTEVGRIMKVVYLKNSSVVTTDTHQFEVARTATGLLGRKPELHEFFHPVAPPVRFLYFPKLDESLRVIG